MSASNHPGLAIPKPELHARSRARVDRLQAQNDRAVYAWVTERDGHRCRACGEYGGLAIHRHHLLGRKVTSIETVCCLCDECHANTHVRIGGKTLRISGNAEQRNRLGTPIGLTIERRIAGVWITEVER